MPIERSQEQLNKISSTLISWINQEIQEDKESLDCVKEYFGIDSMQLSRWIAKGEIPKDRIEDAVMLFKFCLRSTFGIDFIMPENNGTSKR